MGTYIPFQKCTTCKCRVLADDMSDHLAWHTTLKTQMNLIKVALPLAGLDLTLL